MASGAIKGITIQIGGDTTQLGKSLKDVESQIKKDDQALKNLDKALQLDPGNLDLIAAKEAVLADKTSLVSQKMEILQEVQENALSELPEGAELSAAQMAELSAEIAAATQELEAMSTGASNTNEAIKQSEEALKAEEVALKQEQEEKEKSREKWQKFGEAAKAAGEAAVTALTAVVSAAAAVGAALAGAFVGAGKALADATFSTSQLADELLTLSSTTGLATDTLQELNYASELLDVSTDTVTGSMTKLLKNMSSAADGSSSAAEKFTALGISYTDAEGNLRSTEDVFWDAIDVLGQIENESERDAAAMDLFGKSARELNPLIEAGSGAFQDLADEAHNVGYVLDSETLDSFGALDDNVQRLSNTATAVKNSFGQVLLPVLTDVTGEAVDLMGQFSGAMAATGGDIDKIGEVIGEFGPQAVKLVEDNFPKILTVVEQVLNALIPVAMAIVPPLLTAFGNLITQLAQAIASNADSFISAFTILFQSVVDAVLTLLPVLLPIAINLIMTLVNALIENAPMLVSAAVSMITMLAETLLAPEQVEALILGATQIVLALLDGLTTALPILIPAALDAILTIVDTLLSDGCLAQIISASLTLILTLANSLIDYLPRLIERLPEIIIGIVEFLTGDALPSIINAGVVLLTSIVAHLPEIIVAIVGALIELVAGMCDYITTDGAEDLAANFLAVFGMLSDDAIEWGKDLINGFINGIKQMFSKLKDTVSNMAQTVADYLHFSEPDKGPLADFNSSGADMVDNFINSMLSQRSKLSMAVSSMAGVISSDMGSFDIATQTNVEQKVDYTGGLSRIEHAITAQVAGLSQAKSGGQIIIPVYIGNEKLDTLIVDGIDRYNYTTGGH